MRIIKEQIIHNDKSTRRLGRRGRSIKHSHRTTTKPYVRFSVYNRQTKLNYTLHFQPKLFSVFHLFQGQTLILSWKKASSFVQAIGAQSGRFELSLTEMYYSYSCLFQEKRPNCGSFSSTLSTKTGCTNYARNIAATNPPSLWGLCEFSSFAVLFFKDAWVFLCALVLLNFLGCPASWG